MQRYINCIAIVFASLIVAFFVTVLVDPPLGGSYAYNDLRYFRLTTVAAREEYQELNSTMINDWLVGQPSESTLGWMSFDAPMDPWGRPYVYVQLPSNPDDAFGDVHVYSLGEDGQTATQGNDPDDPNTWSPNCHLDYYLQIETAETRRRLFKRFLWVFPLTLFVAVAIVQIADRLVPQWRRWTRFRLSTALIAMTLFAVALAMLNR